MRNIHVDFHTNWFDWNSHYQNIRIVLSSKSYLHLLSILNTYFLLRKHLPIEENAFGFGKVKTRCGMMNYLDCFQTSLKQLYSRLICNELSFDSVLSATGWNTVFLFFFLCFLFFNLKLIKSNTARQYLVADVKWEG